MKLVDFLNDTEIWSRMAIVGTLGGCVGYTYGTLAKVNPELSAKVFGIASLVLVVAFACIKEISNGLGTLEQRQLLIKLAGSITFPCVIYNLNLISSVGAIASGVITFIACEILREKFKLI